MVIAIITVILFVAAVISLIFSMVCAVQIAICRRKRVSSKTVGAHLKKAAIILAGLTVFMTILIALSQFTAHTPQILNENGTVQTNSIAELNQVELNGHQEWISIRGKNRRNPVLLFLAGGPGGTQMAATRYALAGLEERFVVVNWDQPGSGKSYNAVSKDQITVNTYIKDGLALTDLLRKRFGTEKIYLMGESWGSALGIFLADAAPEKYHAFIGTGQMVDFKETEITDYKKAMKLAKASGDEKVVQKMTANGMPPYYGKDVTWKSAVYLNYLSAYMEKDPKITNSGYHTMRDMLSPEYGIMDSINYLRGVIDTFNQVYPQLYDIDLRKKYTKLKIPIYFFLGRHDANAPVALTQQYYDCLETSSKSIVWFEHSGHSPWLNENKFFVSQTIRVLLEK